MSEKLSKEVLKPRAGDAFPDLAQLTLSGLCPPLGLVAGVLMNYIGTPAWRRVEAFIVSLDERITTLEQKTLINKDKLLNNPYFITIVIQASQIAARTHKEEKLKALHNAVLNSAVSSNWEEDKQITFLWILDRLTVFDIQVLNLVFTNEIHKETLDHDLNIIIPKYSFEKDMVMQSLRTLTANGVINEELSAFSVTIGFYMNNFGVEFLKFINNPMLPKKYG